MSFAGALGRGLLGAVGGGAQSYIDDQELKQKEAAETAKMEKMAKIEQEVWAARQKAIEEQRVASEQGQYDRDKGRKESDLVEKVGLLGGYAKGAEELSDREIAQGSVDGKYSSYTAAAEKAIIDGRPDMAKELMVLAGKSPAEATKVILEQQKTLSEIAKNNATASERSYHNAGPGDLVLDKRTGKMVASVPHKPDSPSALAKGDKFTDAQFKAAFHKNTLKQELKGKSVSSSTVSELDEDKYRKFVSWAESNGLNAGPSAYNKWVGSQGGSGTPPAGISARGGKLPQPKSAAERDALKPGDEYLDPQGVRRVKK